MLLKRKNGCLERLLTAFGSSKLTSIFDMLFWVHSEPLETSFGQFLGVQEALLGAIWAPMRLPRGSLEPPWGGIFPSKSNLILHTPFWSSFWMLLGHFGAPFWLPKGLPDTPRGIQMDPKCSKMKVQNSSTSKNLKIQKTHIFPAFFNENWWFENSKMDVFNVF